MFLNVEDPMELQNISTWKEVKAAVVHTTQAIAITSVMMFIGFVVNGPRGLAIGGTPRGLEV